MGTMPGGRQDPGGPALELTQHVGAVTTMARAPRGDRRWVVVEDPPRLSHVVSFSATAKDALTLSLPCGTRCVSPPSPSILRPPRGGPRCRSTSIRDPRSPLAPHLQGGPAAHERVLQPVPIPVSGGHPTAGSQRQLPTGHTAPQEAGRHRHGEPRVAACNRDCGRARRGRAEPARWGPPGCLLPGEQARQAPGADFPSSSPVLAFTASGRTGKEVAPGAELLCAVTPRHRRGREAPEGSPRGDGGDAGPTPGLPCPWIRPLSPKLGA